MRIIAGYLGGRNFDSPKGHRTHPMSEKMRGGLFSALGDIEGLSVLDAFAGSGACGLEAISRGANNCVAIDIDKSAINTVVNNARALGIDGKVKAIRANVSSWSDNNPDLKFDIVICDPPYDGLKVDLLQKLTKHLDSDGIFVLSWPGNMDPPELSGLNQVKLKNYGDSQLTFFKNN